MQGSEPLELALIKAMFTRNHFQIAPDHSPSQKFTQFNPEPQIIPKPPKKSSKSQTIPLHSPALRLWARSWLPTTKAPPVMSEWPPMYLLAEIITSPKPRFIAPRFCWANIWGYLGHFLGIYTIFNVRPLEDMEIEGVLRRKAVPHKICRCEKCCFLMPGKVSPKTCRSCGDYIGYWPHGSKNMTLKKQGYNSRIEKTY